MKRRRNIFRLYVVLIKGLYFTNIFRLYEELSGLVHTLPQGNELCQVKGLYPNKFVLFGERMLLSLGRLYEKTFYLPVRFIYKVCLMKKFMIESAAYI